MSSIFDKNESYIIRDLVERVERLESGFLHDFFIGFKQYDLQKSDFENSVGNLNIDASQDDVIILMLNAIGSGSVDIKINNEIINSVAIDTGNTHYFTCFVSNYRGKMSFYQNGQTEIIKGKLLIK